MGRRILRWTLVSVAAIVVAVVALIVWSYVWPPRVPAAHPDPASSYTDAVRRIEAAREQDPPGVSSGAIFLGQGSRAETAVVLFHGLTNRPKQMARLASALAEQGYSVYVPRLPGHGLADPMTSALTTVSTEQVIATVDQSVDIAAGLGRHVVVSGLSAGGGLAAYAAANRDEVDGAVLIAPLFRPKSYPGWANRPVYQIAPLLPTVWYWWNAEDEGKRFEDGVPYPRFPLAAFARFSAVSDSVLRRRPQRRGRIGSVVVVENLGDPRLDNVQATHLAESALRPIAHDWRVVTIPASKGYLHDLIDPDGENAERLDEIYALLLPLYGAAETSAGAATANPGAAVP